MFSAAERAKEKSMRRTFLAYEIAKAPKMPTTFAIRPCQLSAKHRMTRYLYEMCQKQL